jgi:hypothetical protein
MLPAGLNITVENCHGDCPGRGLPCLDRGQGGLRPTPGYCPWTSYRTSNDIQAFSESWFTNLQVRLNFLVNYLWKRIALPRQARGKRETESR